ncbi:tRNA-specific 2-thiouridylase [Frankliniella fusca]|uniref:tRNA-specific 2-thiouridylase n=1 Tax=Frankliniella fusca TaxID=407009 RepID=A0AAE1I3K9_9NEOP|nr:tRNA-specific 2-thiouridylase [Frankliniella fusca]
MAQDESGPYGLALFRTDNVLASPSDRNFTYFILATVRDLWNMSRAPADSMFPEASRSPTLHT